MAGVQWQLGWLLIGLTPRCLPACLPCSPGCQSWLQPNDRRIAEVQYKRCCALQFSGDVDTALVAVQVRQLGGAGHGWLLDVAAELVALCCPHS